MIAAVVLALLTPSVLGGYFYVPGSAPKGHRDGDWINVTVNTLRSRSTLIPYDYYDMPFCQPHDGQTLAQPSLGQVLAGSSMKPSLYSFKMRQNLTCAKLNCSNSNSADVKANAKRLGDFINLGYRGYMSIENLAGFTPPGTLPNGGKCSKKIQDLPPSARGYALGVQPWCNGATLLNNHLDFEVKYHKSEIGLQVVGFRIVPLSVDYNNQIKCDETFDPASPDIRPLEIDQLEKGTQSVQWTFSVTWIEAPNTAWGDRWDEYLDTSAADRSSQEHVNHIITSVLITLCLVVIAGSALMRTLNKECHDYNTTDELSMAEEKGWKMVHADVFRPPANPELLAIALGNGTQLVLLVSALLLIALLGFLSPANRGGLLTLAIACFVAFSAASGFVTSRTLVTISTKQWKVVFGSGVLFPGALFFSFFFIDLINWHLGAADAVPAWNIFLVFLMWVVSCIPLNVLAASWGFQEGYTHPCAVGRLPREIPVQQWWLRAPWVYVIPASFPFVTVLLEVRFIFEAMWLGSVYYAFGFLFLVFLVWVATVMLTAIITVYFMLVNGDYNWWWTSFLCSGALGFHVFVYAAYFFFYVSTISTKTGMLIYFVYMTFLSLAYGLGAGTVGFLTSYAFVKRIYGSIRVD